MSIFRGSNIGNFTRGGQTTIHYLRMIWQVVVQFSRLCLILFVLAIATTYWVKTTPLERSLAVGYIEAYVKYEGLKIDDATVSVTYPDGRSRTIPAVGFLRNQEIHRVLDRSTHALAFGVVFGFLALAVFGFVAWRFLNSTGEDFANEEFVRGGKLVDSKELTKAIKRTTKTGGMTVAIEVLDHFAGWVVENRTLTPFPNNLRHFFIGDRFACPWRTHNQKVSRL